MKLFTRDTALANWRTDAGVIAATTHEQEAKRTRETARVAYETAWAAATGHAENIQVMPHPGSPVWPLLTTYQAAEAAWKETARQREETERVAQTAAAQEGYDRGRQFVVDELVPILQQLRAALAEYETLQATVFERTSARLGGLGRMELTAAGLDDVLQRIGQ